MEGMEGSDPGSAVETRACTSRTRLPEQFGNEGAWSSSIG